MISKPNLISDLNNIYYAVYIYIKFDHKVSLSRATTVMTYIQFPEVNDQIALF